MANDLISLYDNFNIHPDIIDLLWIKNKNNPNMIDCKLPALKFTNTNFFENGDPSMIDCSLPISRPKDIQSVPHLGYYPSYIGLSPEQRWIYLHFLENPYDSNIEISYVFILYYGLERHLMFGDCKNAFNIIIKLKNRHKHKSFQIYSIRSLLSICLIKKDFDMFDCLKNTLAPDTKDINTVMIINALSNTGLTAKFILNNLSFFKFYKKKYINQDYKLFEQTLKYTFFQHYESYEFPISSYVDYPMETTTQVGFANLSLPNRNIEVPNFKSNERFINDVHSLLDETYTFIKNSSK